MIETKEHFSARLKGLGRKHEAMAGGYTTHLRSDGLIVVKPRGARRKRTSPLKAVILAALGFCAFKAYAVQSMGDLVYTDRVAKLEAGTPVERAGAWAMQIDPLTAAMTRAITSLTAS
ncbi:MAG: hypothetical protein AAGF60_05500 [Pseudomonadota bacterium]